MSPDEITIIVPAFDGLLTVGGKFREPLTDKVDHWIRNQRLTPKQRLKVLSTPGAGEMIATVDATGVDEEGYLAVLDVASAKQLKRVQAQPQEESSSSSDESEEESSGSSCGSGGSLSELSSSSGEDESVS